MFLQNSVIAPFFQYVLFFLILLIAGLISYYLIHIGNRGVKKELQIKINWNTFIKALIFVLAIVGIVALYKKFEILQTTTFALFISVLLAFLLNPIVNYMESKGIKRGIGTIITYISIILIIVFLFVSIIPDLVSQISSLVSNLPSSINYTYRQIEKLLINYNIDLKILSNLRTDINKYLLELANNIPEWTGAFITAVQGSLSSLISVVLVPILTYYLIVDKDRIIGGIYNIIPKNIKHDASYLYKEINFAMNDFVRNRAIMSLFVGVAYGLMLSLFRLPFAWAIGFLAMIFDIVPYIGPVVATVPALIFAFIKSPILFIWVAILSWVIQMIEQNIIGTKLFSGASGLHEIVVFLSIIIGGGILGVWGMILSVPIVLVFKIIIEFVSLKVRGVKPEFTKDKEKQIMIQMKKDAKERQKKAKEKRKQRRNMN
nr:AI-2E family transporter [Helcococcus sueciensis]